MPQIRNTTTEDNAADDEVKEYKQHEDENAVNETNVDLVNDLKSDLIKKDAERIEAKRDNRPVFRHFGAIANPHQTEIFRPSMISAPPSAFPRQDGPYYPGQIWHPNRQHVVYGGHQFPAHYPNAIPVTDSSIRRPPGNITDDQRCGHMVASPMNNTSVICHTSLSGLPNSPGNHTNMPGSRENGHEKKISHVKKPLNAFMLYMKEMRSKVISECTLKESAAINQILGKRWHQLDRGEQAKYYDQARRERAIHMQMYPGWSARENYAQQGKKKKRKRDKSQGDSSEANNPKKCRARYGLDRQHEWCKPCRRKKKCIRFVAGNANPQEIGEGEEAETGAESTAASSSAVNLGVDLIKSEPLS